MLKKMITDRIPRRAVLGSLMFLAAMFSYVIRTNLSIIIVAMVQPGTKKGGKVGPACNVILNGTSSNEPPRDVRHISFKQVLIEIS